MVVGWKTIRLPIGLEGHFSGANSFNFGRVQGGPLIVISGVITPISRVITPSYPFIRPFIGLITPLIIGRGPPCKMLPPFLWAGFGAEGFARSD